MTAGLNASRPSTGTATASKGAGTPPSSQSRVGPRAAGRPIGADSAVGRTGCFPLYAVAVTDQEGVWQWYRSRDPHKARRRAWRYAEALVRCGGDRVLPVTVIETGRTRTRRDETGAPS